MRTGSLLLALVRPAGGDPQYTTPVYRINSGGASVAPFTPDQFVTISSGTAPYSVTVDTSGVANAPPEAVFDDERWGPTVQLTITGLVPLRSYSLRLFFAETYWTAVGQRVFSIVVNGTTVAPAYDIVAVSGAANRAAVVEHVTAADGSGVVVVTMTASVDNAKIDAFEVWV